MRMRTVLIWSLVLVVFAVLVIVGLGWIGLVIASEDRLVSPTATLPPTAVPTEVPTETAVPTPVLAETTPALPRVELGLNPERKYVFSEGYVVDTFNGAKMLKWDSEASEWVDTTLEEKYGHLAPADKKVKPDPSDTGRLIETTLDDPEGLYIKDDLNLPYIGGKGYGDAYAQGNTNYKVFLINPVWTGNTVEVLIDYEGKEIIDIAIEVVFRDLNGVLIRRLVSFDSPALGHKAIVTWGDTSKTAVHGEDSGGVKVGEPYELLKMFIPGQQVEVAFPYSRPKNTRLPAKGQCYYEGAVCTDGYIKNHYIYLSQADKLQEFVRELQEGKSVETTDDMLLPTGGMGGDLTFFVDLDTWSPDSP